MTVFNYINKRSSKSNAYIKSLMLKWTIAYLERNPYSEKTDRIIDILLNHMEIKDVIGVYNKCITLKEYDDKRWLTHPINSKKKINNNEYSNLIEFLNEYWNERIAEPYQLKIIESVNSFLKDLKALIKKDEMIEKFHLIKETFKLTDNETKALVFLYLISVDSDFGGIVSEDSRHNRMPKKIAENLSMMTGMSHSTAKYIFNKNSSLSRYGLIDDDRDIENAVVDFLNGFMDQPLLSLIYRKYRGTPLPLKAHSIRKKDNVILREIIKNKESDRGLNILLYGSPGTGKTEYCRSLAVSLKMDIYELLSNDTEDSPRYSSSFNRFTAFYACQNTIPEKGSIILIDEADEMLNGDGMNSIMPLSGNSMRNREKNKINELLDNSKSVNFWITNHYAAIDESTRRRFDYSIEFRKFDYKQRLEVWKNSLKKHRLTSLFTEDDLKEMANKYEINAGGIDVVLRNYKRIPEKQQDRETLKSLINPHLKLMGGKLKTTHLNPVSNYSLKGLNIKGDNSIQDCLNILCEFSEFMQRDEYIESEIKNMNLLLYGPPGTGKTEFVKYMAKETGRKLIMKSGSDFLDMYVGQTEQNIKSAFQEARANEAILFIDEADGLLFDRNKSQRRFEMTQVNELLIQMENFHGILVCSSNFRNNMDSAAFRRFNLKFEFDYLDKEGSIIFYNIFLGEFAEGPMRKEDKNAISAIDNLTPGDFKVIKNKYAFFKTRKLTHKLLINALKDEVKHKQISPKNKIGF